MPDQEKTWNALGAVAAIGAGVAARKLMESVWRKRRGIAPPTNPADPGTAWRDALAWSLASGVAVGVARLLAQRGAAEAWARRTGHLPPGVERTWG